MRRRFDAALIAPIAVTLMVFVSVGLLIPLTTTTIVDRLNESKRYIGYSIGALTFGAFFGRLVAGALVDSLGTRRGFAIAAGIVAVSGGLYLIPPTVPGFLAARVVHGLGEAMIYTCAATTVMNNVPPERRSRFLGLLGSAVWGGLSIGPALGEWFAPLRRSEGAGVLTLAGAGAALLAARVLPSGSPRSAGRSPIRLRFPKPALLPAITIGCYNLAYAAISGFVIVHLRDQGIDPRYSLTFYAVAVLCGRLALGGLPDRLGPRPSLVVGLSLMFCSLAVVTLAPSRPAVLAALGCFGVGYSMPFPALASVAVDRTSETERASAIAMLGYVYDAFVFAGGLLFGLLADLNHTTVIFGVGMVGIAAGFVLAMIVTADPRPTRAAQVT